MKSCKQRYWVQFLIFLVFSWIYASDNNIHFQHITINDGLSQNTVNCILQDSKGFMWFGTNDGLNRYDGYNYKVYKFDAEDVNSLSNNYIHSIIMDRSGIIWIGTYGGGLNRFDREKEQFVRYQVDPDNLNSLSNNFIYSVFEDHLGALWIGTLDGLNKLIPSEEEGTPPTFIHYRNDLKNPKSLSCDIVVSVYEDQSGDLWIGTWGSGLNRFDRHTEEFIHYQHNPNDPFSLSHNRIWSINEDRTGSLWIATDGGGLNRFDKQTEKFHRYQNDPDDPNSLNCDVVVTIYKNRSGCFWIGTDGGGLNYFDLKTEQFIHYENNLTDPNSLSHNVVRSIWEDKFGILWIGTLGGLDKFDPDKVQFAHYQKEPGNSNSLSHNEIRAIYEDKENVLWIGTDGGGLNCLDRKTGQFIHYRHDPSNSCSLSDDVVLSIYKDRSDVLWLGTYMGGLNRFDQKTKRFIHYQNDPDNPNSISDNFVRCIYEDRSGVLWIGISTNGGLNRFNQKTQKFIRYLHDPNKPHSLSHNGVSTLYEDRLDRFWVGTFGGGLNRFDRKKKQFIHFKNDPNDSNSLSDNRVYSIHEDSSGVLWIGTGGGLNRFDPEKRTFQHYKVKDGLPNDVIYGILEDDHGNLWLSTNNGLSKFNPITETFKNYNIDDGLQSNGFYLGAYYKTRKEEMVFGGINGFNIFYPDSIKDNLHAPPVVITDFQIFNKSVPIGEKEDRSAILKKSITETKEIELSYKNKVISFEFAALHYASPDKNEYAYMMQGFEKDWNYVGNRRFASYTNLPPGDFIFWVKASNNDGIWNEEGISLRITIAPPFWKTWWFLTLGIVLLIGFTFSIYRVRVQSIQKRNRELEAKVNKQTYELKNTNKTLRKEVAVRKRMEKDARRRAAQAAIIYKTGQRVGSQLEIDALLPEIVTSVCDEFDYYSVALLMINEKSDHLILKAIAGENAKFAPVSSKIRMGEGITGYVAQCGETQVSGDIRKNSHYVSFGKEKTKSELTVPLRSGKRIIGVLDIQSDTLKAFDKIDVTAMETLSIQITSALENARLYEKAQHEISVRKKAEKELSQKNNELETLDSVVRVINKEIDLENVLQSLLGQALSLLPQAERGSFLIYDEDLERYRYAVVDGYNIENVQNIHLTKEEVISRYTEHSEQLEEGSYVIQSMEGLSAQHKLQHLETPKSILAMSVILEGRLEGFLILDNMSDQYTFDKTDVQKLLRFREHAVSAFIKAKSLRLLEEKNKNILSSIRYGERIQNAILPLTKKIRSSLPQHFIIFKPRDIVSGDFYWFNQVDGKIVLAVIDCTGHGVPGAFMSMLGNAFLNQIVTEQKIMNPSLILKRLHEEVRTALKQKQEKVDTQDGMDVCLCVLEKNSHTQKLLFAGAKRPLFVFKKGESKLTEVKGDRKSIGGKQREEKQVFTSHEIKVQKGDQLYLTTDGFADQQNPKNKRYGSRRLKAFLQSVSELEMQEQEKVLAQELARHQGREEQRDDITVVGVKV